MKKTFKLRDLDCAACAGKLERAVMKLAGVTNVRVNFMTQKMILDAPDDKFDEILSEVQSIAKKIEPDLVIVTPGT